MVNTRQKMWRSSSKIQKFMKTKGFTDITMFPHTRFSKDVHLKELEFDGMAIKENKIVLFQCKSNKKQSKKSQEEYRQFSKDHNCLALWFNAIDFGGVEQTPTDL